MDLRKEMANMVPATRERWLAYTIEYSQFVECGYTMACDIYPTATAALDALDAASDTSLVPHLGYLGKLTGDELTGITRHGGEGSGTAVGLLEWGTLPALDRVCQGLGIHLNGEYRVAQAAMAVESDPKDHNPNVAQVACDCWHSAVLRNSVAGVDVNSYDTPDMIGFAEDRAMERIRPLLDWEASRAISQAKLDEMGFGVEVGMSMGQGVTVAILGTGIADGVDAFLSSPPIRIDCTGTKNRWRDTVGSGTHLASLVTGDGIGDRPMGAGQGVRLVCVKVLTDAGWGTDYMIADGVRAAVACGADIVLFGCTSSGSLPKTRAMIERAASAGVHFVAPAGDSGKVTDTEVSPAGFPEVISVGSASSLGGKSEWSNYGTGVDFMAYGADAFGLDHTGQPMLLSGTVCAAAYFAAAFARVLGEYPPEVRRSGDIDALYDLQFTADHEVVEGDGAFSEHGRINCMSAQKSASLRPKQVASPATTPSVDTATMEQLAQQCDAFIDYLTRMATFFKHLKSTASGI